MTENSEVETACLVHITAQVSGIFRIREDLESNCGGMDLSFSKRLTEDFQNRNIPSLKPGDTVQVRSENEILATLDNTSALEGLPFNEEMRKYCGGRYRVLKRVHKIIIEGVGNRLMKHTVILEGVTCDGEAHGGCRRTCLVLWKEAWLRRTENKSGEDQLTSMKSGAGNFNDCNGGVNTCQCVNLLKASSPLHAWDIRHYFWDIAAGTYSPLERLRLILIAMPSRARRILVGKNPKPQGILGTTPTAILKLQPGEIVEVKSKEEILATLDLNSKNRGLIFAAEMIKYCGKRYRVLKRLDRMYIEQTGTMRQIANTVLLEGVTCDGRAHGGCLRTCYCLFREIWLRRAE
jgi:hypothetical protein